MTTNCTLSCKLPPKKMARKNVMRGPTCADGLQTQELKAWGPTTCNTGDRKRHHVTHDCEMKQSSKFVGHNAYPKCVFFSTSSYLQRCHWPVTETLCPTFVNKKCATTETSNMHLLSSFNGSTPARPQIPGSYSDGWDRHINHFTLQKVPCIFQ